LGTYLRRSRSTTTLFWETFVAAWWERFGKESVAVAELLDFAEAEECLQALLNQRTLKGRRTAFGKMLRRKSGTPVGRWIMRRTGVGNHTRYCLEGANT